MAKMDFSNYMAIASNGYKMLLNAFYAYHDGNIAKSENIMLDVLSYLHDNHFFSYMLKSDFENNEMDYDFYKPQMIDDDFFYLGEDENDFMYESLFDVLFTNAKWKNCDFKLHCSASFLFTIFGFYLGEKLNNKFGV